MPKYFNGVYRIGGTIYLDGADKGKTFAHLFRVEQKEKVTCLQLLAMVDKPCCPSGGLSYEEIDGVILPESACTPERLASLKGTLHNINHDKDRVVGCYFEDPFIGPVYDEKGVLQGRGVWVKNTFMRKYMTCQLIDDLTNHQNHGTLGASFEMLSTGHVDKRYYRVDNFEMTGGATMLSEQRLPAEALTIGKMSIVACKVSDTELPMPQTPESPIQILNSVNNANLYPVNMDMGAENKSKEKEKQNMDLEKLATQLVAALDKTAQFEARVAKLEGEMEAGKTALSAAKSELEATKSELSSIKTAQISASRMAVIEAECDLGTGLMADKVRKAISTEVSAMTDEQFGNYLTALKSEMAKKPAVVPAEGEKSGETKPGDPASTEGQTGETKPVVPSSTEAQSTTPKTADLQGSKFPTGASTTPATTEPVKKSISDISQSLGI